ncbi:hypothetical protein SUGI_1075800 [Cryptomeria japonica]|uniref:F-box/kelch-repeat protein At5g15710-like n=1 Tax=Cryptomeria japonica TaxID=3369 RepID=UPI002414BB93|nr:F-box/kelch-repeat protein At5g15710-like [Cryptomeria japonica]GLJ50487.1 hypothetical protein SUGI_1075800 [Cryptomeria japonica]
MWSDLPEHLKERVMESLPVDCFFRFRAVCKIWNALLSSEHFNSMARNSQPFLILCPFKTQRPALIYSFFTHTWRPISLSFIPYVCPLNIGGSASGLLLVDIQTNPWFARTSPVLYVCNPLSKTCLRLPGMACVRSIMAKTIAPVGAKRDEYKVMVIGRSIRDMVFLEVYNSASKSWKFAGRIPDVVIRNESMIYSKGCLFCMIDGGMMAYNIEQGITTVVAMPTAGAHNVWPRLICCESRVIVVGAIEENYSLKGVIMWEVVFHDEKMKNYVWEEIVKMPDSLFDEFRRCSNLGWFQCGGVGDKICLRANVSTEMLVYDVSRGSWSRVFNFPADLRYVSMRYLPLEVMPNTRLS